MRIKRLEIVGFKSFCDRMVLSFNDPITGVVGPNGCGKSNIVDAIRWCMGEQSAKQLRGGAMQDVIFAGSDSRGPLGMCEVTMVFENDGRVPIDYLPYAEIAVTRKLYRDGTSEYYLNKTPCRLRDITDFFLGTGIGAKAYSIIEQGRVGMIVSSKPEDRRFLIEEAAGITKYKQKKKAAEKKMEGTRQNLLRVSDVVAEIEKQLGSLRRQAQKAERYKQYKSELKDIDLWSASQRWLGLGAEERVVGEAWAKLAEAQSMAADRLATREASLEAARLEAAGEEQQLSELQQSLYELDNRVKLHEAEIEHEEREVAATLARADEAAREIDLLELQGDEAVAELERVRAELAEIETAMAGKGAQLAEHEEVFRARKEEQSALAKKSDAARAALGSEKAEIARAEAASLAASRRREDLEARLARLGDEESRLTPRAEELRVSVSRLGQRLAECKQLKLELVEERGRAEARLAELKTLLAEGAKELDALVPVLHQRRSRRASLEEIQARYEGFAGGTRAIMQQKDARWGIHGLLVDVLSAPAEYEVALEAVLAERLGAVLVETQEVGVEAVDYLKAGKGGRASFFPLNRFTEVRSPALLESGVELQRLIEVLRYDDAYAALVSQLFGDVVVVEDLLAALDLWRSGVRTTIVTREGEVVERDGTLTGGSREGQDAGVLAQKREIRELDEMLVELEQRHADAAASQAQFKAEREAIAKTLEALQKDAHAGEMQLLTIDKDLQRDREELERAGARLNVLGREQSELAEQAHEAAREAEESTMALRTARDRLVTLEDQLSTIGRESLGLVEAVERASELLTALKVAAAQSAERRSALERARTRLDSERADKGARKIRLAEQIQLGETQVAELRAVTAARKEEVLVFIGERGRLAESITVGRTGYEARRLELSQAEGDLKVIRGELDGLGKESNRLELRRHELASARTHLEESVAERYRVALCAQIHDYHLRPLVGEVEERRAKELRDLIDRMGEINLNAIEEYNELETRYTFLCGQKTDLETALEQLEEAIARINRTSKTRFREVFDLVNQKFQELFPRCFKGGQARLVLTDEDNLLESGIEIIAQPPGKKNSTVELLSGGEKAMTAVALIFAIFLIKPSPFCLLDEVDAPLDEANVGRFNDLIRELTDRTQFIVITHNKRTMQIADTLYGVTMEEPGISKLVSVNLGAIGKDAPAQKRKIAAA